MIVYFEKMTEQLCEIKNILQRAWGNYWTVYKQFEIDNSRLTFKCDTYFEPIFSVFVLIDYGVIEATVENAGTETDRVVITSANLDVLRQLGLSAKWPDAEKLALILEKLGCAKRRRVAETGPVYIVEGDIQHVVPRDMWKAYWATKGKTGPSNGFEIPTYAEIQTASENKFI